jgi:CDGSH-type Zn-finger protein
MTTRGKGHGIMMSSRDVLREGFAANLEGRPPGLRIEGAWLCRCSDGMHCRGTHARAIHVFGQ